jgi:quercetin dioxygenase-like cupin family protein
MSNNWHMGNAADEESDYRGWVIGHFIDSADAAIRQTSDVEVKWGIHPAGQERAEWTTGEKRTTLILLVTGKFHVDLSVGSVVLARQGDYLSWGPGIEHSWHAEEDSVVITIRWPSIP